MTAQEKYKFAVTEKKLGSIVYGKKGSGRLLVFGPTFVVYEDSQKTMTKESWDDVSFEKEST